MQTLSYAPMQAKVISLLKNVLDRKSAGLICILLAIANKSLIALVFSSLIGDKALYLLFAECYLQTGLFAEPVSIVETGSTVPVFNPAVYTPLYSLLAAPLLWLTKSFFLTQLFLSVFAWTMLYVALYYLAKIIFAHRWLVHLFILCSGFFLYPHELSSTPKDTLAVGLVLSVIVLMTKFLERPNKKVTGLLVIGFISLALIKLMYIPLVVALFFLFAVSVLVERKKTLFFHFGFFLFLLLVTGFIIYYFLFQPLHQLNLGQNIQLPVNQTPTVWGFYPSNLLYTYPFISSSLFNIELWGVQLEKFSGLSFPQIVRYFLSLDVILFVVLLAVVLVNSSKIVANRTWFFLIGVSLVMVAVTLGLSIIEKPLQYKSSTSVWTYVSDARSFLLPIFTIQLALFLFIFSSCRFRLLRVVLFLIIVFECFHGVYFTAKQSIQTKVGTEARENNDALTQVTALVQNTTNQQPALVTSDNFLRRYAQVKGIKAYAFTNLKADLRWMKKGEVFLIATHVVDSAYLEKFPAQKLVLVDTVPPLILHRYVAD